MTTETEILNPALGVQTAPTSEKVAAWDGLFTGIYTLWLKHMRKFRTNSMEIAGTLATPVLWMLFFGACMSGMAEEFKRMMGGISYQVYITPGVMMLTGITAAILGGATLLIERTNGVIKEYLVAPVPRLAVLLGTLASGLTKALLQSAVVLLAGVALGAKLTGTSVAVLGGIVLVVLFCLGFVGIAAAFASKAKGMESYHTLIMVMNLPVLFLSNALYPLEQMPAILRLLAYLNPTTYAVDATRHLFYGLKTEIGLGVDVPILLAFCVAGLWFGFRNFRRYVITPAG